MIRYPITPTPQDGGGQLSLLEVYDRLRGGENFMYGVKVVDAVISDRAYSVEKAKRELGYMPKYDLRRGLYERLNGTVVTVSYKIMF